MQWINILHNQHYEFLWQTYHRPKTPPEGKPLHVRSIPLKLPQLHPRLAFSPFQLHCLSTADTIVTLNSDYRLKKEEKGDILESLQRTDVYMPLDNKTMCLDQ